jgi:cob(I)alamin adenosyltransferase
MQRGYVQIYTGEGKGKTTAAIGLAVRAAGAGLRVWFGQFLKGRACGEHEALRRFEECITVQRFGAERFVVGAPRDDDRRAARKGLGLARAALYEGPYQVVILDEICAAITTGLIDERDMVSLIERKPLAVELVLTGRNAPQSLIQRADLVTEMKALKHYFDAGVEARPGIEC